jgi:hypothetical protein
MLGSRLSMSRMAASAKGSDVRISIPESAG